MKKLKVLKEIIKYKFDEIMANGLMALVGILVLTTAIIVLTAGFISSLVSNTNGMFYNIWASLMHTIDPGTITSTSTENRTFLTIMSIVTLFGIFITSILIGIVTSGFEEKLRNLKKGNSSVVEKNHTLILGFGDGIYTFINQLAIASENGDKKCVVVLAPIEKEDMESKIKSHVKNLNNTKIVCRTGDINDLNMLEKCKIQDSKSIFIDEPDDFMTIKAILAINKCLAKFKNSKTYAVAIIKDEENYEAAMIAAENNVEVLLMSDLLSKLIAQTCRQPGLSRVLLELFDHNGNEIYIKKYNQLVGKSFTDSLVSFKKAVLLGYKRNNQIHLNPKENIVISNDDELIILQKDDSSEKISPMTYKNIDISKSHSKAIVDKEPYNILILGVNSKLPHILYYLNDSFSKKINVIVANKRITEEFKNNIDHYSNINLTLVLCDTSKRSEINKLLREDVHQVVVLNNDNIKEEVSDSITLTKLLHLRDYSKKTNKKFSITSEMFKINNEKLASIAKASDIIVGENIVDLILTQISECRHLSKVFSEILSFEGNEIYMIKAMEFVKLFTDMNFYQVTKILYERNKIAIGYTKQCNDNIDVVINPIKTDIINFTENDYIIVLSEY